MKPLTELLQVKSLESLSTSDAISHLGQLIDASALGGSLDGMNLAQSLLDEIFKRDLALGEKALLYYFRANLWGDLRSIKDPDKKNQFSWTQPELDQEIIFLRMALLPEYSSSLPPGRRIQILTNLAGKMSVLGRLVEAIEYWDQALEIFPAFGMALGNKGVGLETYGRFLYDEGHSEIFFKKSYDYLEKAMSLPEESFDKGAKDFFKNYYVRLKKFGTKCAPFLDSDRFSLGKSTNEKKYRVWCLKNRLFLNPLNDLSETSIAGHDIFGMPSMTVSHSGPPSYFGYFNQLKQEFASARFLYFSSLNRDALHFSDKGVHLYNTYDYPVYGYGIEQLKLSFRSAYSLFDKISYFLRNYFELDIAETKVNFRSVWYEKGEQKKGLNLKLSTSENVPLRGLFWLSKDIFSTDEGFTLALEPEAQKLKDLRNHLEHKYLKIHSEFYDLASAANDKFKDKLAYSISLPDFQIKTLRVLKMARAAIVYTSLAVHREEGRRLEERPGGLVAPMFMDDWKDEWKR